MAKAPETLPDIRSAIASVASHTDKLRLLRQHKEFDLERVKGQKDIAARYAFLADLMMVCGADNPEIRKFVNDAAKLLESFGRSYTQWISTELPQELADTITRLESEHERLISIMKDEVDKETCETILRRFDIERPTR